MKRTYISIFSLIVLCCAVIIALVWYAESDGPSESGPPQTALADQDAKGEKTDANPPATPVTDKGKEETEPEKTDEIITPNDGKPTEPSRQTEEKVAPGSPGKDPNETKIASDEKTDADQKSQGEALEDPNEPEEPMEAVNLKDVEMKSLLDKIAQWTGKVVIPHQDVMGQKLTVISDQELPRQDVLEIIYAALKSKGFVVEEEGEILYLKPSKDARIKHIPTIGPDQPLALLEDKNQRVQKLFKLNIYSPTKLQSVVQPMITEGGHIMADDATKNLVVIETVDSLMRIERIIKQLDVPEAEETVTDTILIRQGEPVEMVRLLGVLIGGQVAQPAGSGSRRGRGRSSGPGMPVTSVFTGPSKNQIVLIPVPRQKWIIARAAAEDMKIIREWVEKLDIQQPVESEYETVAVQFVPAAELAEMLNRALQQMPGAELKSNVLVEPLSKAKQLMIFGSEENREMVKKLILESDIPSDRFITQQFKLKHVDTEHVKEHLEALYEDINANLPYWRRQYQSARSDDSVRVISFPTAKQVTVIASAENMVKIAEQIKDWDKPIDVDEVKPHIYTLRNTDPVRMAELLSTLFSETTSASTKPWWYYAEGGTDEKRRIVGPLFGQLTFEAVPDTKKIIVISNIPAAYPVVEQLINELDSEEIAEIPIVITLEYADPEDLCDQMNALLNEPGTPATLRRSRRGLSQYVADEETGQRNPSENNQENRNDQANVITPWWTQGREATDEMPISNLIGKIRFIPVARSKAVMVLTPPEYKESLQEMIRTLDKPGKQVMIKAVVLEIDHNNMTSLGVKFSTNPSAFGTLSDNAVAALAEMFKEWGDGDFTFTGSVTGLVDLLVRETEAKVLNQPTLWTKDNEEAEIFKGESIPFLERIQSSTEGISINQSVDYRPVGVTLRTRPNITPENAVDMTINLVISKVKDELVNDSIATNELNTTTHVIVKDGETIILSGMLFQNDSKILTKLPLLGDLPLIGGLFSHEKTSLTNNELLVFITPYVMDDYRSSESKDEMGSHLEKLEATRDELDTAMPELEKNHK